MQKEFRCIVFIPHLVPAPWTPVSPSPSSRLASPQYDMAMVLPLATFDEAPATKNGDGLSGHDIIQLLHFQGLGT